MPAYMLALLPAVYSDGSATLVVGDLVAETEVMRG